MHPSILAGHCAFSHKGKIEFPETAGWKQRATREDCLRVILRGGFYFDAPDHAVLNSAPGKPSVALLTPATLIPAPCLFPRPQAPVMPYDYWAANNRGVSSQYQGYHTVTEAQAELLGWILGDGSLHAERQSIRFTSADQGCLHRVQNLSTKAFPNLSAKWYAKNGAYDMTLTAGIANPLKHFIRMIDFYEGCPMAVGRHFDKPTLLAFLRGLWGAQGWVYIRKGGNDVLFGLNRLRNEYLFSWLRLLHASLGLQGSRELSKEGSSRLVFNGFRNYQVFMREIGQFGSSTIPTCPVRKQTAAPPTYLANGGETWYDAPVIKVMRLGRLPVHNYESCPCLKPKNTKPITALAPKT